MPAKRRKYYTDEFKAEAVQLVAKLGNTRAAKRLKMPTGTLSTWCNMAANGLDVSVPKVVKVTSLVCPHCGEELRI